MQNLLLNASVALLSTPAWCLSMKVYSGWTQITWCVSALCASTSWYSEWLDGLNTRRTQ